MPYETITCETGAGAARITMNRPEAMNAITPAMLAEMKAAVLDAGRDAGVRVIVITGAGRAFCAGVDLKALGGRKIENGTVVDILDVPARGLIDAIRAVPVPVIALVNGFCFTGALELVLACDMAIAAEEAKLGDTHARWGLRPTWGMSARLPRRVGFNRARELSFTAGSISGREAERIGLVNRAVPADKLEEALRAVVDAIIANSAGSVAAYKSLYNAGESLSLDGSLMLEFGTGFTISDTGERLSQFRK
ncbi:MAG TPA: enoyl-CoA hydratase/isomerase family protein [Spirochaetota bacterium]|nr:enoyl-CoA hydratase/isomerase family protein [Spirochaetota bacterium]